jgi:hypothetical protein
MAAMLDDMAEEDKETCIVNITQDGGDDVTCKPRIEKTYQSFYLL